MNNKFKLASLALAALIVLSLTLGTIHPVRALTPVSTVYITPNATGPLAFGSTFTVSIFGDQLGRSASSGINSWDLVFTTSDPTFTNLQPTAISTTGNLLTPFGSESVLINCVNGVGIGCDGRDGPGVVHTALGVLAPATPAPISGLVATITYTVTGFAQDTISILSPCPGVGTSCDTLADGSGTGVPHITLTATIGTSGPDYGVTTTSTTPFNPGGTGTGTVTATSLNAFAEAAGNTLKVTTDVSGFSGTAPLPSTALTVSCGAFSPSPLTAGGISSSNCTFSSSTPGVYVVTANVTDGPASCPGTPTACTAFHLVPLTVSVGDFTITGPASAVSVPVGNTGTGMATTASVNGFAGTVNIAKSVGNPDFTLAATSPQVPAPGSASSNVALANANGLTGATVALSTTVPAALSCSGLPATSSVPATLSLSCSSTTTGTFIVTLTGTTTIAAGASSFTVTHTATAAFTYSTLPDFAVSAKDANAANAGDSAKATISVFTINGGSATKTVSLSTTVPAGLTCSAISPASVILPPTQAATLSCSSATTGSFAVTVTATNTTFTRTATTTFNFVNILSAACPTTVTLTAGGSSPISCSFSSSRPGSYLVTIIGTFSFIGGSISHQATLTVNVADYTVTTTATTVTIQAGSTATAPITLTGQFGWNRPVALTVSSSPVGVAFAITGNPCTLAAVPSPTGLTRQCVFTANTPGTYQVTVTGNCPSCAVTVTRMATFTLQVVSFNIAANPSAIVNNRPGTSNSTTLTFTSRNGFNAGVTISNSTTLPAGSTITCTPMTLTVTTTATSACTVTSAASTAPNTYTVTFIGTGGGSTNSTIVSITVVAAAVAHTTTTGVSCVPSTVAINQASTCTATVTDIATGPTTPTGTVTFSQTGTAGTFSALTCTLAGTGSAATCSVTFTPSAAGSTTINAAYGGDSVPSPAHAVSNGSTSATDTLRATSTTISCAPATLPIGQVSTCTATVTDTSPPTASTPTGTVTFSSLGGSGSFSVTTCALSAGACSVMFTPGTNTASTVSASYGGDTTHAGSNTATAATVTGTLRSTSLAVSCSPSSVPIGQPSTCTATVTDTNGAGSIIPSGQVIFAQSGGSGTFTITTCVLVSGSCSVAFTPNTIALTTIAGTYNGDSIHSGSNGNGTVTGILRTTSTTVSCAPSSVPLGQQSTCSATLVDTNGAGSSTPTGMVLFSSTGAAGTFSAPSCTLSGGSCSVTFTPTASGTAVITGAYGGDATHATSSGQGSVSVNVHPTTTTVTCTPTSVAVNQPTSCTATVTDMSATGATTPTGSVAFTSTGAGTFTGTCMLSGTTASTSCTTNISYTPTAVGTGTHVISGTYSGDATHSAGTPATTNVTVTLRTTTTSVACSPASVPIGQASTCVATVADTNGAGATTPTGTVTFARTGGAGTFSALTCSLNAGTCSVTFTPGSTTASSITGAYGGDAPHAISTSAAAAVTGQLRTTSSVVSCSPASVPIGQPSSCTATVADSNGAGATAPTGTVTFASAGGAGTFSGSSCSLASGTCSVTFTPNTTTVSSISASYGGDSNHSGSSAATAATVTGVQTSFTISATSPASVPAGTPATSTITITGQSGFAGTITLSDNPLPTGLTCQTLNPTSVTLPPSPATALLSCSSPTPAAYMVTITAASGTLTLTTTATFTFSSTSQGDFTLSVSPTSITLVGDSPERAIVTLHSNGFNGTVDVSVKISPTGQGLAAHLVRIHVPLGPTSTQKIVLLVSGDEANAGDYTVTVTGTSGSLSHSASLKVTVTHPDNDQEGFLGQFFGWFLLQVSTSRWD